MEDQLILKGEPRRKWHIWVPLLVIVGIVLYTIISYFVVGQFKSKPKSKTPTPTLYSKAVPTESPRPGTEEFVKAVKEAQYRALEKPQIKVPNTDNAILKNNKDYQIDYVGKDDEFHITLYNKDFEKTRKAAEEDFINNFLRTSDKKVICAVKVLISAHPEVDIKGKFGYYEKLSFCEAGNKPVSLFDSMVPKAYAQACNDVWRSRYYCSCEFLSPFFGRYTYQARVIAARESACNPNLTGDSADGAAEQGLFQINPIHPDATYDPAGNARAALRISRQARDWNPWSTCRYRNANDCTGPITCLPAQDTDYSYTSSCPPPSFDIRGTVWVDNNRNGRIDSGEGRRGSVSIRLSNGARTSTAGNGAYTFSNVRNGTYTVSMTVPAGFVATTATSRSVRGGPDVNNVNFGIVPVYTISGTVFLDHNRNDIRDSNEVGCNGCTVRLLSGSSVIRTTRTNNTGNYIFTNVYGGTYRVVITMPADFVDTTPVSRTVTVGPSRSGINFGITNLYRVHGRVYLDVNKNGVQDPGEATFAGPITLSASRGTPIISGGSYQVWNIPVGGVRASYTNLPTPDYYMTYPLNGPPPSFNVSVGINDCDTNGARGATCNRGDIYNLNFGISNIYPWFQAMCGNIRMDNGITNRLSQGMPALVNGPTCTTPGIAFSGDGASFFGKGQLSSTNWLVGGTSYPEVFKNSSSIRSSYAVLDAKAQQGGITPTDLSSVCNINDCNLPANLARGIYKANGNVLLNAYRFPAGRNYVFLINGRLTLNGDITMSSPPPSACVNPPANLAGWWKAEGDGTDSANNNNGALQNGTLIQAGKVGRAFEFDGSDSKVTIPYNGVLNTPSQVTIEAWIRPTTINPPGNHGAIVSKGNFPNSRNYYIGVASGGKIHFAYINGTGGNVILNSPDGSIAANQWQHVVGVIDWSGGSMRIYINGALRASTTITNSLDADTSPVVIGSENTRNIPFAGLIDEVSIYRRALSASEIQSLYNAQAAGKCIAPSAPGAPGPVSTAVFSATGDIIVDRSVGDDPAGLAPHLEGIYTTDGSFIVNSYGASTCGDLRLNIAGSVIVNADRGGGGSFRSDRDLCGAHVAYPAVQFIQRLDVIYNLPEFIKKQDGYAWEAEP